MTADTVPIWTTRDRLLFGTLPPTLLLLASFLEYLAPYSERFAGWPFAVSLLLIGLPHGAADLAVSSRMNRTMSWLPALCVFSGYLAWMLVVLGSTLIAPLGSLLIFAFFSAWHFGSADVEDLHEITGGLRRQGFATVAARGVLILALPFASQTAASAEVVDRLLRLLGSAPICLTEGYSPVVAAGLVTWALLVLGATCAFRLYKRDFRAAIVETVEIVSILSAFLTLHPLFAMGLYFLVWHSWRHTRRVSMFLEGTRPFTPAALLRLHLRSLPLLIPTLLAVAAVLWWRSMHLTAVEISIVALAVFLVVTPAHHFLVERLHAWNRLDSRSKFLSVEHRFRHEKYPECY